MCWLDFLGDGDGLCDLLGLVGGRHGGGGEGQGGYFYSRK